MTIQILTQSKSSDNELKQTIFPTENAKVGFSRTPTNPRPIKDLGGGGGRAGAP